MDIPPQIGRYRIVEPLGRGSMARVFLALDPHTDRKIALKVVSPAPGEEVQLARDEMRRRFLLEARAAGRLNHPGIVTVYDADTDAASGLAYIAMEWVEGSSLAALLAREQPLPIPFAVEIVAQVALALDYAHRQGIVHRDIKPGNILITVDGRAKISDFGIARLAAESHTIAGQILGTPSYMSPEQVRNEPIDGRTDLYALGVVLYQAVTGALPARGDSLASIAYRIAHVEPRPPAFYNSDLPEALGRAIEKSLAKDPAQRFQTGAELALALAPFRSAPVPLGPEVHQPAPVVLPAVAARTIATTQTLAAAQTVVVSEPVAPLPPAPSAGSTAERHDPLRRRRRWIAGTVAAGLAVLALVVIFARLRSTPEPEPASAPAAAPTPAPSAVPGAVTRRPPRRPPTPRAAAPAPVAAAATLRLVHNNRLRNAVLTVWVDGKLSHSAQMAAEKNLLRRVGGEAVAWTLTVPEGEHTIEVRITSAQGQVDASGTVRGAFTAGGSRVLRVLLIPFNERLRLSWEG